jgi:hypothetical protein
MFLIVAHMCFAVRHSLIPPSRRVQPMAPLPETRIFKSELMLVNDPA